MKEIRDNQLGWNIDDTDPHKEARIRRKILEGSYPNQSVPDENKLCTVLRLAWKGKIDKLRKYFENSFKWNKVNRQDEFGRTALHFAASWGDTKLMKLLLNIPGIKLDIKDANEMTPLFKAVEVKSLPAVKLPIEDGEKYKISCRDGRNIVEYLIGKKSVGNK